jgi:hypothetical protein
MANGWLKVRQGELTAALPFFGGAGVIKIGILGSASQRTANQGRLSDVAL